MDPYITTIEADAYAAAEALPDLAALRAAWAALSDAAKGALLGEASDQIDSCRWQGRKFLASQDRQFPRVHSELPGDVSAWPQPSAYAGDAVSVWDWDSQTNSAVVPDNVLRATWYQALSLLDAARAQRLDDRHDGVTSQSAGGASETYDASRPANVLCRRAWALLGRYRLRTGRIA